MRPLALLAAISMVLLCRDAVIAETNVSTFAGSGATGYADGSSQNASFMLPLGVAYDADGNLYVADAAAQRIRKIARDGSVRTLAGGGSVDGSGVWTPGGYVDGDGSVARFNHPSAVAIGPDGRAYVADSYNHCIRVVAQDGAVSTLAGSPARSGLRAGPRDVAEFIMPMGLAFDRKGNLYVVDAGLANAVRKIDRDGVVSDVKLPGHVQPPGGLAVVDDANGLTFVLADLSGLYVRHADESVTIFRNEYFRTKCAARTAPGYVACDQPETILREHRDIGTPIGVAAFNDHIFAYTDFRTNSVRYVDVRSSTVRLLAGYALEDGSGRGAGARDGEGRSATFNMPFGIAIGPSGELAIADGGSRRVRVIRDVDRTEPLAVADAARTSAPNARRVVAYAGDATVWQGTEWGDSIEGRLQRRLNESACTGCKTLQVVPVVLGPSFKDGLAVLGSLPNHRFDVIVLQLNVLDAAGLANVDVRRLIASPGVWRTSVTPALQRLDAAVKRRGSRLLILAQPLPSDVGPATALWARDGVPSSDGAGVAALEAAVAAAGVPLANAMREFAAAENAAVPAALFSTDGTEFASGGREALAMSAARALLSLREW